ncbi:uncharacterized protein RHOBADRAFT_51906 [Rhodotorula graminis WP1]|uniref:Uncharacterized protein n=1 Tax=Rhodotorula graminis (strain WP1) TaxID=578459 RepID=A0A194S8X8_RHOGW|nr:uncharacterized protein RHOBADRAFT_51906 [Rhodotorula graminis WP1]KPV76925.1 hypothetical protein RHOBADRAFT_51906 [Rhodotorula graminis WP1]
MPSIKAFLSTFVLVALALAPTARAGIMLQGNDLVHRSTSQPSLYSNTSPVEKRSPESREKSAARVKRAKLAAAKKARRGAGEQHDAAHALLKRHITETYEREGVTKSLLARRALFARVLKRYRCGQSKVCAKAVTDPNDIPANGAAICDPPGYFLAGGVCIQSSSSCGSTTCGSTDNGAFLCTGANVCTLVCDTANGYVATPQGTCVSLVTSPSNCGAVGNVCPGSYNGIGKPQCRNRNCQLNCPPGYYSKRTQDRQAVLCYGA